MPSFSGEILPTDIAIEWSGGPAFDNEIIMSNAGVEWRTQISEMPRYEYDVSYPALTAAKRKKLTAFFLNHAAQAKSFRFLDHLDQAAGAGEGFFFPTDTAGEYQMYKRYVFGSLTFYRKITKPFGTPDIVGGSNHVIDYDTGIVTCDDIPFGWAGAFHVHARFNMRQMRANVVAKNQSQGLIVTWTSIPIVEVKAEEDTEES